MNKLAKYIAKDRYAVALISKKTGISKPALYNWASGRSIPRVTDAVLIEKATRNRISVYDWGKR